MVECEWGVVGSRIGPCVVLEMRLFLGVLCGGIRGVRELGPKLLLYFYLLAFTGITVNDAQNDTEYAHKELYSKPHEDLWNLRLSE